MVQASLRIRAVSPEPSLLAHTSSESRGTFRQKARSLAPLNGWACAVKICHDGMLEDTNSLDGAQMMNRVYWCYNSLERIFCVFFKGYCGYFFLSYFIAIPFCFYNMGPVKGICVFDHSVMTNFNCACPAIQRDQGSGFLSEGSS